MRKAHRYIAIAALFFGMYIAVTGLLIQAYDLSAVLGRAPADDPTMRAIRVGLYGPPNFQVLSEADFTGAALPGDPPLATVLPGVIRSARIALAGRPLSFLEFRVAGGRLVADAGSGEEVQRFDAATSTPSGPPRPIQLAKMGQPSPRNLIKNIHRFRIYGGWAITLDIVGGLVVIAMIVTGLATYWQLLRNRLRMRRRNPFWQAGGWWRTLHRGTAIVAAFFLLVIAVTGTVLSISSLGVVVSTARTGGKRPVITDDFSQPLTDAELPAMLRTTLAASRAAHPGLPLKVVRLRYFAGLPQGVVIGGEGEAEQFVYDARDGRELSLTEPNYPAPGQTFGWQVDETFKRIHRGDYFGLTGRWMSVLSGLALLYLSVSGALIYLELWKQRRRRGRHGLFWSP